MRSAKGKELVYPTKVRKFHPADTETKDKPNHKKHTQNTKHNVEVLNGFGRKRTEMGNFW